MTAVVRTPHNQLRVGRGPPHPRVDKAILYLGPDPRGCLRRLNSRIPECGLSTLFGLKLEIRIADHAPQVFWVAEHTIQGECEHAAPETEKRLVPGKKRDFSW